MLFALELSLSGSRRDTTREFLSLETALNRVGFVVQSHQFPEKDNRDFFENPIVVFVNVQTHLDFVFPETVLSV